MNQTGNREHLTAALSRAALDWTTTAAVGGRVNVDRDLAGNEISHWYLNADDDRVDLSRAQWSP